MELLSFSLAPTSRGQVAKLLSSSGGTGMETDSPCQERRHRVAATLEENDGER